MLSFRFTHYFNLDVQSYSVTNKVNGQWLFLATIHPHCTGLLKSTVSQPLGNSRQKLITRECKLQKHSMTREQLTSFISRTPLSCAQTSWSCWISMCWDCERVCSWLSCSSLWAKAWFNSRTRCSDWPSEVSNLDADRTQTTTLAAMF